MKCECGYDGDWARAVVLCIRVRADKDGKPIIGDFTKKNIPYGSVKKWIEKEAESQDVHMDCPECGAYKGD